jgi:heat shock protein HslJ
MCHAISLRGLLGLLLFTSLAACHTPAKLAAEREATLATRDSLYRLKSRGVDFRASGNVPAAWWLEMNFNDQFYFSSTNGKEYTLTAVNPSTDSSGTQRYQLNSTDGPLQIAVFQAPCINNRNVKSLLVEVTVNNTVYTGCGNWIGDPGISEKWVLDYIGNQPIDAAQFPAGIPYIQINSTTQRVSGFDGCNQFSGTGTIEGDRIRFGNLAATRKFCSGNPAEKPFSFLSGRPIGYKIIDESLMLSLPDDSRLIFKKSRS